MGTANLRPRIESARSGNQRAKDLFADARRKIEPEEAPPPEENKGGFSLSDLRHTALDVAGFIPVGRRMLSVSPGGTLRGSYPIPKGTDVGTPPAELLRNGRLSVNELMAIVPKGTPSTFVSGKNLQHGFGYLFRPDVGPDAGKRHLIKFHEPDLRVPGSNAANGWTAQVQIGNRLLKTDGTTTRNAFDNEVHIPLDE